MEARVTEMEREARREKQLADAQFVELNQRLQAAVDASATDRAKLEQLADLTRRLQDEANMSAAHRVMLEEEIKKLQDRAATVTKVSPPLPPRPTLCVQVLFYSATHDS